MPAKLYPFIDIAVHERVREHFARGDAAVLFAADMSRVLWSNGQGADLFGMPSIYDFLDTGANKADVAYRQMDAAALQLKSSGERRTFLMRVTSGFQRVPVNAAVERIAIRPGEDAILFTAPRPGKPLSLTACAQQMISGFDDPDTHMAVLDGDGGILAESPGFSALSMTQQTRRALVNAVARDSDWLVKRPVPTGKGHLPAAIGKLSEDPALHLLFAVETILGNMDPGTDFDEAEPVVAPVMTIAQDGVPAGVEALEAEPSYTMPATHEPVAETLTPVEEEQAAVMEPDVAALDLEPKEAAPPADEPTVVVNDDMPPIAEDTPLVKEPHVVEDLLADDDNGRMPDFEPDLPDQDAQAETIEAEHASSMATTTDDVTVEDGSFIDEQLEAEAAVEQPEAVAASGEDAQAQDASASGSEAATEERSGEDREAVETIDSGEETVLAPVGDDDTRLMEETNAADRVAEDEKDVVAAANTPSPAGTVSPETEEQPDGFVFNPAMRAARFVWKIDADGQFSEISSEFAAAVGPNSADIVGQSFDSLAQRYGLDTDNTIGSLLKRRDTWSGKMILWPVEGTRLSAPVDLAALPTYSRNREFDGFRGFGIVRVADAVEDPHAMGLTIGAAALPVAQADPIDVSISPSPEIAEADAATPVAPDPVAETGDTLPENAQPILETETQDEEMIPEEIGDDLFAGLDNPSAPPADVSDDPFRGERPALKLVNNPVRRESDKIVQIEDHRTSNSETLTRSEQAAFREIARQLGEKFGTREPETGAGENAASDMPPESSEPESQDLEPMDGGIDPHEIEAVSDVSADIPLAGDEAATSQEPVEAMPVRASDASRLTPGLLDTLPIALLIHLGEELFHANPEFLKLTGYETLQQLQEEGGIDALFASEDEVGIDTPDGAIMLIRNDGNLLPVTARLQSVRWDDKNALMMALSPTLEKITTDGMAPATADEGEIALLRIETEELRSILETATDGVVVVGAEGDIRSLNRSANALFNYDDSEVRGKPFAMLFAHESQKAVLDYLAGLSGHGVASVLNDGREVIGREASGGFIPLFMTMGRLSSSNGYCAVIRDITQWKRTEEELRTAKRAAETANAHKTEFLARVSHEIRTPLNAIIGFSDMTATEHFGPIGNPRYVEYASDIGRSGRHVLDIVNDLLDISKIEAGEMDLEFTAVEINDAVSEAVSLVQPQANSQRVIIRTSLSGSVPNVVADTRSIKQIALNILANAIRFTPSGGQIVVSTAYEANGSVILRIRDTGVGMTRTELEQAMKPFRQVTTGVRQRGDGTGLGLPLTKAMAEANRAQFSINSAPNEGTLVEISFPSQRVLAD